MHINPYDFSIKECKEPIYHRADPHNLPDNPD